MPQHCPIVKRTLTMSEPPVQPHLITSPLAVPSGTYAALAIGLLTVLIAAPALAIATSVGALGAVVAIATYAASAVIVASTIGRSHHASKFGLPNAVTLARLTITALVAGYTAEILAGLRPPVPLAIGFAALALTAVVADGLDGWLARARGPSTAFGARFDMESDALLLLALSVLAFGLGKAGPWVILIGAMRYLFIAAGQVWRWLEAPLAPSYRRKAVCVLQGAALTALALPVVTGHMASAVAAIALAALTWSFAVDTRRLHRRKRAEG
jgi:phosphatidylglycerophosphate synthase